MSIAYIEQASQNYIEFNSKGHIGKGPHHLQIWNNRNQSGTPCTTVTARQIILDTKLTNPLHLCSPRTEVLNILLEIQSQKVILKSSLI